MEIDEDNYLPEATRDVIFSFCQNFHVPPSPLTSAHAPEKPLNISKNKDCDANNDRSVNGFREPEAVCRHGFRNENHLNSLKDTADVDHTFDDVSLPEDTAKAQNTISMDNNSSKRVHKDTMDYEDEQDILGPNLHHLVQLTEALRRNSCFLQLTMGQAASLIAFQARRVFSGIVACESLLKRRISTIIKKYFDEVTSLETLRVFTAKS